MAQVHAPCGVESRRVGRRKGGRSERSMLAAESVLFNNYIEREFFLFFPHDWSSRTFAMIDFGEFSPPRRGAAVSFSPSTVMSRYVPPGPNVQPTLVVRAARHPHTTTVV